MRILKSDPSVKMLLIDDMVPRFLVEDMREAIQKSFPLAIIDIAHGFLGIENLIKENRYRVIFLDSNLQEWPPHPVFKQYGGNMIPFIRQESPGSIIVSISSDDDFNEEMMKRGADIIISKKHFKRPISEELTQE